jgi:hypothetical protein
MEESVPKRWHVKFRSRGIAQKKEYSVQNTAKVWNQVPEMLACQVPEMLAHHVPEMLARQVPEMLTCQVPEMLERQVPLLSSPVHYNE